MRYRSAEVEGIRIFYREAGRADAPVMLLLHGFPSASHMFRDLMPQLEDRFHLIAPDLPGFGQSDMPSRDSFAYTFDHLAQVMDGLRETLQITSFFLYVFDYGAPIGFRLALKHPEMVQGIISQNGNVYEEGLGQKWQARKAYWEHPTPELRTRYQSAFAPETIIGQYTFGTEEGAVSPDGYSLDIFYTQREGYAEVQSDLIFDYQTNVRLYPRFQDYLRTYQPPLLAVWGKNDPSFIPAGAYAFQRDAPSAQVHLVDSGHFALESRCGEIAQAIRDFTDGLPVG